EGEGQGEGQKRSCSLMKILLSEGPQQACTGCGPCACAERHPFSRGLLRRELTLFSGATTIQQSRRRRCSSTAEHRFRKAGVVGSNPTIGSRSEERRVGNEWIARW